MCPKFTNMVAYFTHAPTIKRKRKWITHRITSLCVKSYLCQKLQVCSTDWGKSYRSIVGSDELRIGGKYPQFLNVTCLWSQYINRSEGCILFEAVDLKRAEEKTANFPVHFCNTHASNPLKLFLHNFGMSKQKNAFWAYFCLLYNTVPTA